MSNLFISSATILPNDGSSAHSSSMTSLIRSLWEALNVIIPTVSLFLLLMKNSLRRETIFSASALLALSSHIPFTLNTSIGGLGGSITLGET